MGDGTDLLMGNVADRSLCARTLISAFDSHRWVDSRWPLGARTPEKVVIEFLQEIYIVSVDIVLCILGYIHLTV